MRRVLITLIMVAALLGLVLAPASTAMAASATRSLTPSVTGGADFEVNISTFDFGPFGQVAETLPDGFSYVSSTLSAAAVDEDGQVVKFTLLAEDASFSYTVKASTVAGPYTFNGTLMDADKEPFDVSGQSQITVLAPPATRSLTPSVTGGADFEVNISTFDFGPFGQVAETLPDGFSYVSSTLSEAAVDEDGQVVKFTLLAEDTDFSYIVKASTVAGIHTFNGTLMDADKEPFDVSGDDQITVTAAAVGDGAVGAPPTYYTETNLFGTEARFRIDWDGEILQTIEATSENGMLTIAIPKGTIALDKDGKRLKSLQTAVDESPPTPPEDAYIIGLAYDFGPDGATFDPAITFTWTYVPADIPKGIAEEDLVLAYYDEAAGQWVRLECVVDTESDTITGSVEHFTTFAIIGSVTPLPPPAPAAFSVSNLSVQPAEVAPKEAVTIAVSVANTGGMRGSYTVVLKINGVTEAEKRVTIAAGKSQTISFTASKEDAGSYSVVVNGLSGSFTVVAPAPPPPPVPVPAPAPPAPPAPPPAPPEVPFNWPLVGGIIAAVIVVALLIYFFLVPMFRRD